MSTVMARLVFLLVASLSIGGCASLGTTPAENANEDKSPELLAAEYTRGGDRYFGEKQYQQALVQYMLALEQDDKNADTFFKVGTIHRLQNNLDLAERSFKQSIRLSPGHVASREGLGLTSLRKENYAYAKVMLEGVIASDEKRFESMNALGVLHDLQKEYATAQEYYLKALELSPRSPKILNNLGYSYYLQQDWPQAEKYFRQAVTYQPKYSQGWSNLALVYLQQGQIDNARLAFEKTVDNHQALNNIGYFEYLRNKPDEALKNFQLAIKSSPKYYSVAQQNISSIDGQDGVGSTQSDSSDETVTSGKSSSDSAVTITRVVEDTNQSESVDQNESDDFAVADQTTEEDIRDAQQRLTDLGYEPGPVDGVLGNKTVQAVRDFQRDNGISVDGIINNDLLDQL